MAIADEKYVALTTFRRNGERKSTPVWIAQVGDEVGFTTAADSWKMRRLRNDPRVELQACNGRGVVTDGALVVTGRGREAEAAEVPGVEAAIKGKYGISYRVISLVNKVVRRGSSSNSAMLITLD
jgi:PPOX class probable F420-dependent enzyme